MQGRGVCMNQFSQLKKYLSNKITKIDDNLKQIEKLKTVIAQLEQLIQQISDKNYESIDFTSISLILKDTYQEKQIQDMINCLLFAKEFAIYADDEVISQESQMKRNKTQLTKILSDFSNYLQSLKIKLSKQKLKQFDYEQEKLKYEKFLKLVLVDCFDKNISLNLEDYEIFCQILLESTTLDKSVILNLISELSVLFIDKQEEIQLTTYEEDNTVEVEPDNQTSIQLENPNIDRFNEKVESLISKIKFAIKDINEVINKFSKYIDLYRNLPEKEKNLFSSLRQLITEEYDENILISYSSLFHQNISLNDIKVINYMLEIIEIKKELEEYSQLIELIKMDDNNFSINELENLLKKIESISQLKTKIEDVAAITETKDSENLEEIDFSEDFDLSSSKNLLLYLKSDNGYYLNQDIASVGKMKNSSLKHISAGLTKFYTRSLLEIKQSPDSPKTILPSENIVDYSGELKPYRLRHSDIRIAYIQIPLTKKNKEILGKVYNIQNDFNLILVVGISLKNAKLTIYDDINRRIAKEITRIRKIKDIFAHDLDENTLKIAIDLIDGSFEEFGKTKSSTKIRGGKNNE